MRRIPALLAVFALSAAGCSKGAPSPGPVPPPSPEVAVTADPAKPEAAAKPAPAPKPAEKLTHSNPKAYKPIEAAKLGTLPEGVGIAVGTKAPDATVTSIEGKPVSLAALGQDGPLLLVFYRGGW